MPITAKIIIIVVMTVSAWPINQAIFIFKF